MRVFEELNCKVTILSVVGAFYGQNVITARVGITLLVLFLLVILFIFNITIVSRSITIVF